MQNFRKVTIYQTGKEGDPDQIFFNCNFSRNTKISLFIEEKCYRILFLRNAMLFLVMFTELASSISLYPRLRVTAIFFHFL